MATKVIAWLLIGARLHAISAGLDEDTPILKILVSDHLGITEGLETATETATAILGQAGIIVSWSLRDPIEVKRACRDEGRTETPRPDLTVIVVATPLRGHAVGPAATGMALIGKPGQRPSIAYVYNDRVLSVLSLAGLGAATRNRLLGHVIAHEIGHLLGARHSPGGIMQSQWKRSHLWQMSTGYLLFRPEEGKSMRQNARDRFRQRER